MNLTYSFKILIMEAVFYYKKTHRPLHKSKKPAHHGNLMLIN